MRLTSLRMGKDHPKVIFGRGQVVRSGISKRDDLRPHNVPGAKAPVNLNLVFLGRPNILHPEENKDGFGLSDSNITL